MFSGFFKFDKFPSNIRRFHTPNYITKAVSLDIIETMNLKDLEKFATRDDILEAFEKTADKIFKKVKMYFDRIFSSIKIQNRKIKELEKELIASQLHQEELEKRLESLEEGLTYKEHLN